MKYVELMWASLFRRKLRTILTLLSVLAAFLLFGLLDSVRSAFLHAGEGIPSADRLITNGKSMFGGTYRDPKNPVPIEAYDEHYLDLYPEWYIPPAQRQAFRKTRTDTLAGEILAKKYNWKIGDRIPLQTNMTQ